MAKSEEDKRPNGMTWEQEQTVALQSPFAPQDIHWLPQRVGCTQRGPWAMVSAYVDARALQERLDGVFGVFGWRDEYRVTEGGIVCRLSVLWDGAWIEKENGAEPTHIEAFKGGISTAFKRVCASGYGIGRYLYSVESMFADCMWERPRGSRESAKAQGWNEAKMTSGENKGQKFYWQNPTLPNWALPLEHQVDDDGIPRKQKVKGEPVVLATPYDVREIYALMRDKGMMEEDQHALLWEVGGVKSRRELPAEMLGQMKEAVAAWEAPTVDETDVQETLPI